ncbi:hypothetical protein CPB84DRAFT_1795533 [Gymnopilus junonius]|uniref:Uncharacterized protein n=1 Tax=Gymnopilus junonius TaxID=109634 RepID=A0A9P5NDE0_GYMJU|nr:hypothetical protein CPB84DRAFT_1795533 [Gymnopilus junonius]
MPCIRSWKVPATRNIRKSCGKHLERNFDHNAIRAHVDHLRTGRIKLSEVNSAQIESGSRAKTKRGGTPMPSVLFGPDYHDPDQTSDTGRVGMLLHEATHALFGTKDYFSKNDKQAVFKSDHQSKPHAGLSGCKSNKILASNMTLIKSILSDMAEGEYHQLKKVEFSEMHKKADSWKAFGYHALHGKPHPHLNKQFLTPSSATGVQGSHREERSKSPAASGSKKIESQSSRRARSRQRSNSRTSESIVRRRLLHRREVVVHTEQRV